MIITSPLIMFTLDTEIEKQPKVDKTLHKDYDFSRQNSVYLPNVSYIESVENGEFYFEECCDNYYNGTMDAEAFQNYINACQKLLDENKS